MLTLVIGARAVGSIVDAGRADRVLRLHSSESHPLGIECEVDEQELDIWDATSEKTEDVEEEADEERDGAYG